MKITNSEIHKNDLSSLSYSSILRDVIKDIRENINFYIKLRKVNTGIFGLIHALKVLVLECAEFDNSINKVEAQEWKEILMKYFERIEKKIPGELKKDFKKNLEEDLEVILQNSKDLPEWFWKRDSLTREIKITVQSQELKDRYQQLADDDERYDNLGNALHNYLKECLDRLDQEAPIVKKSKPQILRQNKLTSFQPSIFKNSEESFTYLIDNFEYFLTSEQIEEDFQFNAYDLETALKLYLKKHNQNLLSSLQFDCESSLFSVQSTKYQSLLKLNTILFEIGLNSKL